MPSNYVAPGLHAESFTCPHCGVLAMQRFNRSVTAGSHARNDYDAARCDHCTEFSLWHDERLVYPDITTAPPPNVDLAEDERRLYDEAASIASRSPRAAAALLRLVIEHLCLRMVAGDGSLNSKIGLLVTDGRISVETQRALDAVRIVGNNAVHPVGQIDIDEQPDVATALFRLVNFVAEKLLTEPREISAIYESLPESQRAQVAKRDGVDG